MYDIKILLFVGKLTNFQWEFCDFFFGGNMRKRITKDVVCQVFQYSRNDVHIFNKICMCDI